MTKPLANKAARQPNAGSFPKSTHGHGGAGYGGPAKGAHEAKPPAPEFETGNQFGTMPRDPTVAEKRARMLAIYEEVAEDKSQPGMARISAADKWLDRHEGKPIARSLTATTDDLDALDDAALAIRQAAIEARLCEAAGGTGAAPDPARPDSVVH